MKKRNLLLLLIIFNFQIKAQSYSFNLNIGKFENLNFSLNIFDEGKYILSMTHGFYNSDNYALHLLSYGNYNLVDNIYTLRDEMNKYEMCLEVVNIKLRSADEIILKTIAGFKWMKDNYFVLANQIPDHNCFLMDEIQDTNQDILNMIEKHDSTFEREYKLSKGIYKSHNMNYTISLNTDNSYSINFYGYPLSVGKWERNQNSLLLYDTALKKSFIALIRGSGRKLTSLYLPFEFKKRDFIYTSDLK